MAQLARIYIYPIKSLDGVLVDQVEVLPSGALRDDRALAMVDAAGQVINGKRTPKVHGVRSRFDLTQRMVYLRAHTSDQEQGFHLDGERPAIAAWLSDYFDLAVSLQVDQVQGFPDDTASPGPTLISTATLTTVASWFPGMGVDEARQRFRTNLEIDGVPAFWEDHLFSDLLSNHGDPVEFQLGQVRWLGINPCQRCIVPTRDPHDGTATPRFQLTFIQQRKTQLPDTVARDRFNHFYRLAINTRLDPSTPSHRLAVGDELALAANYSPAT